MSLIVIKPRGHCFDREADRKAWAGDYDHALMTCTRCGCQIHVLSGDMRRGPEVCTGDVNLKCECGTGDLSPKHSHYCPKY